jgi:hypothetical protein
MVNEKFPIPPRRGGSSKKREANVNRNQEAGHVRRYKDYFDPVSPIFQEKAFRHLTSRKRVFSPAPKCHLSRFGWPLGTNDTYWSQFVPPGD